MKKAKNIPAMVVFIGALLLQHTLAHAQANVHAVIKSAETIRPFKVHFPDADLKELRNRIRATRWPDKETVTDQSQGARLSKLQGLVNYWGNGYDWRKAEARLNALPQFTTTIDGVDIHFIHVRSKEANALPLVISHGWPGSIFELLNVIGPLTNPVAYGGKAEDAFDVVIPSLPGFGFSGKPTVTGWDPDRIAQAWAELMKRIGYTRYVAQGGDWGAGIVNAMARQAPAGLVGIHNNLPATLPPDVAMTVATGGTAPAGLSPQESAVFDALSMFFKEGNFAYLVLMTARPQAVGYGLTDSPAGLAAWLLLHPGFANWSYGGDPKQSPTKDEVLDDITLYWLTNTATSSARIYWENKGRQIISAAAQKTHEITLPVAITVFSEDIYRAPETWAKRAYPNLVYFREVEKGGHFAAWEQPQLFTEELRAAFRLMRAPAAISIIGSGQAQQSNIRRTDLQRHDLSIPGREVIQTRIDFAEGAAFGKHSHPGEEIIYVIEGTLEYEVEGKPPVKLKAGEVLFIPAGTIHAAKNVGRGNGAELATYVVEKGKPLLVMAR